MSIRLPALFAAFVLVFAALPPAAADAGAPPQPAAAAPAIESSTAPACVADDRFAQLTQTECCKGHKGICGCRAGKIVCCDGTASKEPGCTCHGDDGLAN